MKKPFAEILREIVKATECYTAPGQQCTLLERLKSYNRSITGVHYLYGSGDEIRNTLADMDKSQTYKYRKYPVVVLITPLRQKATPPGGYDYIAYPKIGIAYHTQKDKRAPARYESSFNNVLLPILEALQECMAESRHLVVYSPADFKIDYLLRDDIGHKPFLNLEGMTHDYIDAIEITNCEVTVDYFEECKNNC